jgi:plastocyanin
MRKVGVALIAVALVFTACAKKSTQTSATPAQPQSVSLTAINYGFKNVPTTLHAGVVNISLTDAGTEPHQGQLIKLNAGVDALKLINASKSGGELAVDQLGTYVGGPNAANPFGGKSAASVVLQPGKYAFVCQIPDAKGRPHLSLGMAAQFDVTGSSTSAKPSASASASGHEYTFTLPTAWNDTISFTNNGTQPHELQLIGVAPGHTPDEARKAITSPTATATSGPPPYTALGGTSAVAPGHESWFTANLKPGTYFAMCFITDKNRHVPHFVLGMIKQFTVK